MIIKIADDKNIVKDIVEIHMKTFKGFFLTFLGRGFLKQLYLGFMNHDKSDVIVAINDNNKVLGFLAFSEDLSGFYKFLIKKKLFLFGWFALGAFFRKPKVLFRLLRAFTYSDKSKSDDKYIEISSIGVNPDVKSSGIGTLMIKKLIKQVDFNEFSYIKLETDQENNELANHFYKKNGFKLVNSYETPEKRKMNEYRYYGEK